MRAPPGTALLRLPRLPRQPALASAPPRLRFPDPSSLGPAACAGGGVFKPSVRSKKGTHKEYRVDQDDAQGWRGGALEGAPGAAGRGAGGLACWGGLGPSLWPKTATTPSTCASHLCIAPPQAAPPTPE